MDRIFFARALGDQWTEGRTHIGHGLFWVWSVAPPPSQIRPKYFGPRFGRVRTNGAALKINYVGPFTKTDPWLPLNCPLCNRANRRAGFWINSKSFYVDHEYGGFFTTVQDQSKLQNQAILLVQRKLFEPKLNYTRVRVQHVKEKIVEFVELFVK